MPGFERSDLLQWIRVSLRAEPEFQDFGIAVRSLRGQRLAVFHEELTRMGAERVFARTREITGLLDLVRPTLDIFGTAPLAQAQLTSTVGAATATTIALEEVPAREVFLVLAADAVNADSVSRDCWWNLNYPQNSDTVALTVRTTLAANARLPLVSTEKFYLGPGARLEAIFSGAGAGVQHIARMRFVRLNLGEYCA